MLILSKFLRDRSAAAGAAIVLFAIVVAVFDQQLAPYPEDAYDTHILLRLQPPSAEHPFGTDMLGRDLFSRVIIGTENALVVALAVVAGAIVIGAPLGLLAGYFGGWLGEVIMRVTDVFLAVPNLILAIALALALGPSLESAIVALALTYWPYFCRTAYAETRSVKSSVFVEALQAVNAGSARIVFMHILPNTTSPIIVRATLGMGYIIMTAAVLGFLGMGEPPPTPTWGGAIAESREHLPFAWWLVTFPGAAIFLAVLGFNLLGDGLRDVIDPRLRRSR